VAGVLAPMHGCVDAWFAASTGGARGLADDALVARAAASGVAMAAAGSVVEAMEQAAAAAVAGDRIVVFGSFMTVGPALSCV